jgi:hypothetical protein
MNAHRQSLTEVLLSCRLGLLMSSPSELAWARVAQPQGLGNANGGAKQRAPLMNGFLSSGPEITNFQRALYN